MNGILPILLFQVLQKYYTFGHVLSITFRLDKKNVEKIYHGLFKIFPFENCQFLRFGGILGILSSDPANKVHTRKCFDYKFLSLQ